MRPKIKSLRTPLVRYLAILRIITLQYSPLDDFLGECGPNWTTFEVWFYG